MRLTIIPLDGDVYEDGVCYMNLVWEGTPEDVHALQWHDVSGWIEYKNSGTPNEEIVVLPAWAYNAMDAWAEANNPPPPPPPPPPTTEENQSTAQGILSSTDWATISDVADPINSPYLANQDEFIAYRNEIRKIAVYPTAGDLVWATPPIEVWK